MFFLLVCRFFLFIILPDLFKVNRKGTDLDMREMHLWMLSLTKTYDAPMGCSQLINIKFCCTELFLSLLFRNRNSCSHINNVVYDPISTLKSLFNHNVTEIILRVSIYFCLSPGLWGPLDLTVKEARCKWLHTIRPEVQGEVSQRWMRRAGQRLVHWFLIQLSWEGRMRKEGDLEEG